MFINLPPVSDNDVRIKVTWSGMCHSDIIMGKNDWKLPLDGLFPMIPGHEIIGDVIQLGEKAKAKFNLGQTLGFGVIRGACGACQICSGGLEQNCPKVMYTYPPFSGGYSTLFQGDADWFFQLPSGMDVSRVAPLFCAGVTVYSPLKKYLKPGFKVGIAGIGGLGHIALQFASKIVENVEVTAFSTRPEKEQECRNFGAHKFLIINEENIKAHIEYFNIILFTASGGKLTSYLQMLRAGGKLCLVGQPPVEEDHGIQMFDLLRNKEIKGSSFGSRQECQEMLQLCAKHNIYPQCEFVPFTRVNEWMPKLLKGQAKYRYVIDFNR